MNLNFQQNLTKRTHRFQRCCLSSPRARNGLHLSITVNDNRDSSKDLKFRTFYREKLPLLQNISPLQLTACTDTFLGTESIVPARRYSDFSESRHDGNRAPSFNSQIFLWCIWGFSLSRALTCRPNGLRNIGSCLYLLSFWSRPIFKNTIQQIQRNGTHKALWPPTQTFFWLFKQSLQQGEGGGQESTLGRSGWRTPKNVCVGAKGPPPCNTLYSGVITLLTGTS